MVVNWLEWSDCKLTLHENRPGKADETLVGTVVYVSQGRWVYSNRDESLRGEERTRDRAQRALLAAITGTTLESL